MDGYAQSAQTCRASASGIVDACGASGAPGAPSQSHAFISYVREDSGEIDALQKMLEAAGIPVWRDTTSLWPGETGHRPVAKTPAR